MKVYLAGGFHSNWQERVMSAAPQHTYFNPKANKIAGAGNYTAWDKEMIKQSDIVFVYYEEDNPSGIGLAYEAGYGMGLNKTVIFVCEKQDRYAMILLFGTSVAYSEFNEGIEFLRSL